MPSSPERPWEIPARYLVLIAAGDDRWRWAIYHESGGITDGRLDLPASADVAEARAALLAKVTELTGLAYDAVWTGDSAAWSADVTPTT